MLTDNRHPMVIIAHLSRAYGSDKLTTRGPSGPKFSPEFCLKLVWYLFKAGYVPGDTWGGANFGHKGHNLNKLGRGLLVHVTYQISRLQALWLMTRRFCHVFPYISLC